MKRLLSVALAALAFAPVAHAAPAAPYTSRAFHEAQAAGRPILVDAHADWCPICRAQAPTIAAISRDPAFARLVILTLDYDRQVEEKRELGIRQQSTLIAFKAGKETGRAVGITDPEAIRSLAQGPLR